MLDSGPALPGASWLAATPAAASAAPLRYVATAYCTGTVTAAGVQVRPGIAAADPELLPIGSIIEATSLGPRYNGVYTVLDTGPAVQGREIDLYMPDCREALRFGRRRFSLGILRLGWNPQATAPDLVRLLFRRREEALRAPLDARTSPSLVSLAPAGALGPAGH
jgi:3D (Asp-Asp-Asp) domain-containing protein